MKKICYIVTIPGTIRAFFIPQLKYLADNNFDVTVICSYDEKLQAELGNNIRYIPIEIPRGMFWSKMIQATLKLYHVFRQYKFDMIQYSTPNAAFCCSIAGKMAKIRVRNYHLMGFRYMGEQGIKRVFLKSLEIISCRLSTFIECVSKSNLEFGIKDRIFAKHKADIVWNGSTGGVDLKRFAYENREVWKKEVRDEVGFKSDDFIFGFVGRVTKDKGINELLDAFLRLEDGSKLFIVGPFENENNGLDVNLLEQAKKSNNIVFHDAVTEVEKYYSAIDMLVLPSYREGFGNAIIEAAAVGTPAIVSNIPGPIDAILKNKTAFTVNVRDASDLFQVMKNIKEVNLTEMSLEAYAYVKDSFDSDKLNLKILERKQKMLSGVL